MNKKIILFVSALTISVSMSAQKINNKISGDLIIYHAGSLSMPFKEIAVEFNKLYPDVKVLMESAGSVASARKITDLNRPCDILASSDYGVIDNMLIPKYADWNIKFVSNELSIVYQESSRLATRINSKNWCDILMNKEVAFGRSDPNADPCGYRTLLSLKLAEKFYQKPGFAKRILDKDKNYIRPKEVDLVALLESGSIDSFARIGRRIAPGDQVFRDAVMQKLPTKALQEVAVAQGMQTMWQRGLRRVYKGQTTLEEILPVFPWTNSSRV